MVESTYGLPNISVDPHEVLTQCKAKAEARMEQSRLFTEQEKAAAREKLDKIGNGPYPPTVQVFKDENALYSDNLNDLGAQVQIQQNENVDMEQDEEVEQDQEMEIHSNQHRQASRGLYTPIPKFLPWSASLDPTDLHWLEGKRGETPPLYRLKDSLKSAREKALQSLAKSFSGEILSTHNFTPSSVSIFGPLQKPIFEMLFVEKDDNKTIILLDQQEAEYWRNKLTQEREKEVVTDPTVKLALFDIEQQVIVSSGKTHFNENALKNKTLFQRTIIQLKFITGHIDYTKKEQKILERWIKKIGVKEMRKVANIIHDQHGQSDFDGSTLNKLFWKLEKPFLQEI